MVGMGIVRVGGGALWCGVVGRENGDLDDAREASAEPEIEQEELDIPEKTKKRGPAVSNIKVI